MTSNQRWTGVWAMLPLVCCPVFTEGRLLGPMPVVAGCPWQEVVGERLLDQPVGDLSCKDLEVSKVAFMLAEKHAVPLSFVQADNDARVSLDLHDATVRQVLEAVVARAPS
jgi:hypothetical protein